MKKYLLITSFLFFAYINAQSYPQWLYYSNGSRVTCIEENGNSIWVGTSGGLVQIDRQTMHKTFYNKVTCGIPFNVIKKIFFDAQNRMWVIGNSIDIQLAMYDGNAWTSFRIPEFGQQYSLDLIDIVQTTSGDFWVAETEGLVYIDKNFQAINGLVDINASNCNNVGRVSSIESDNAGNVYYAYLSYWGIKIMNAQGITSPMSFPDLAEGEIVKLEFDSQGILWAGSQYTGYVYPSIGGGEASYLNNGTWNLINAPGVNISHVYDISFGSNGEVFIATSGNGIISFKNNQYNFLTLNHADVDTNWTTTVHYDQDGTLWFSTLNYLYRLKNNTIQKINVSNSGLTTNDVTVYQKQDGTYIIQEQDPYLPFQMNTYTSCLINNFDTVKPMLMKGIPGIKWKFEDNNGNLWGTSRLSLHKLNDTILTTYTPDPAIYGNHLYLFDVCNDTINKKIWIGSDEGLLSFVNNSFSFESNFCNNVGSSVTAVFVDSNGGLWAGSNGRGVGIYKNGLWKSQNFTWTLYNDYIKNIVEDKNHALWFNNLDGDLGKLQNGVWTIYNSQNSPIYGYNLSPPVFDSQNNMYVMDQYTGIRILKNTVWDSIMIKTSNLESYSYGLMFDKNENLWISGNGITIYNPNGIVLSTDEPKTQTLKSKTVITYPNPANYGFNIILDEASKYPLQIMLYDIFGREVLTQSIQSERKVITNSISNGVYIIRLEDAKGKVFMNKLVIEH